MNLTVHSTTILESAAGYSVEMTLSDGPVPESDRNAIQFRVMLETDLQYPRLAELQQVAKSRAIVTP